MDRSWEEKYSKLETEEDEPFFFPLSKQIDFQTKRTKKEEKTLFEPFKIVPFALTFHDSYKWEEVLKVKKS